MTVKTLPGIDLLDLDRFQRLEHHEMFKRLREEAPVYWHEHPKGAGLLERRRATRTSSPSTATAAHVLVGDRRRHRSSPRTRWRTPAAASTPAA